MDDLRKRLKKIRKTEKGTSKACPNAEPTEDSTGCKVSLRREQLDRLEQRRSSLTNKIKDSAKGKDLDAVLKGNEVHTPFGPCYEIKSSFPATYRHGRYCLDAFSRIDFNSLDIFCGGPGANHISPEAILFLDLETTGLSLGTGTYVFLVGLGYFRAGKYWVHQFFLRNFQEEPALLYYACKIMGDFQYLVTFNGKRFDIPLLEARLLLCAQAVNIDKMVFWDLLYPTRRLWSDRLENCRLGTIEHTQLGIVREGMDIPGDMIPDVYFRYIHKGNAENIDKIVYHNVIDILSLTTLMISIDKNLENKDPLEVNVLSIGRYYENRGGTEVDRQCYEIVSQKGRTSQEKAEALYFLARQWKRQGRNDKAYEIWKHLIKKGNFRYLESIVEMAKYFEHKTKEFDEAIKVVTLALNKGNLLDNRYKVDLQKRLERLHRKRINR